MTFYSRHLIANRRFESNILNLYGDKGKTWLDDLPRRIDELSLLWNLHDLTPVANLSYNYVLSGFQETTPIILKLGLDNEALVRETFALNCFSGYGAANVLATQEGAILLERAIPGTPLTHPLAGKDIHSVATAAQVMKRLHQAKIPENHTLPHINDWLSILDKEWNLPSRYLQKARTTRDRLLQASGKDVLLHGDLHYDNILLIDTDIPNQSSKTTKCIVIDPKGVIGKPINEAWTFIIDIEKDVPFIAQYFEFNIQDLFDWYFVHVVLAACWTLEDSSDSTLFLNLARKSYPYVS